MRKLLFLSSYIMLRVLKPLLPADHVFKKDISLDDWARYGTDTLLTFSIMFWEFALIFVCVLYYVWSHR